MICNVCGKEFSGQYVEGKDVYICHDCLKDLHDIYHETLKCNTVSQSSELDNIPKPKELKEYLDEYIIGQDEAKETLAVAVYNHYKRLSQPVDDVEIAKSSVLCLGNSGSGKTLIAQTIARKLNVGFAIADATVLTESGYVGEDVESVLTRLLQNVNYDVAKAERGIIFIDEIDKIARKGGDNPSITRDVSGEGVQQGLLKLLEDSDILVPPNGGRKHPDQKYIKINTKNILFICAGAFVGIERIVASRMNRQVIGFNQSESVKIHDDELLEYVTAADLKKFGFIPEILGRLPVITHTNPLTKDALIRILTEPKNALVKQYVKLFEMDGIKLTFEKDALDKIAEYAFESKLGARGLRGIMERVMKKHMFNAPSDDNITEITITLDYVNNALKQ